METSSNQGFIQPEPIASHTNKECIANQVYVNVVAIYGYMLEGGKNIGSLAVILLDVFLYNF